jgi:FAD/FMN-containing dehydrogenase
MTTIAQLMRVPPAPFVPAARVGELTLLVMPCWTGDIEDGQREVAKLRAAGEPIAEMVAPFPYPVMYEFTKEATNPHGVDIRSMFANTISDAEIDAMIDAVGRGTATVNMVQIRGLGGAMARVDAGATAFAHRDKQYMVSVLALWADAAEDPAPHRTWTRALWEQIRGAAEGVYVNFLAEEPERLLEAYPRATYDRLAEVKRAYDPDNVFTFNHNIRPR